MKAEKAYQKALCTSSRAKLIIYSMIVIKSKDPAWNYMFAKDVEGADKKAHEKVVLESKDPQVNYWFARFIEGTDKKAHTKVILESNDPSLNYWFAKNVGGADVKKFDLNLYGNIMQDDCISTSKECSDATEKYMNSNNYIDMYDDIAKEEKTFQKTKK